MNFAKCCFVNVAALASVFCFHAPAAAANSENPRFLPSENIVTFAASNPTVQLQLDALAGAREETFGSTTVTVVDQAGNARKYSPNDRGMVEVTGLQQGLYTVIAFNSWAHAAMVFAARQSEGEPDSDSVLFDDALGKDFADKAPPARLRVTMMRTVREKLVPLITDDLVDDPAAPVAAIDQDVVAVFAGRRPYDYQVKLGRGGVLRGQLITVMRQDSKYSAVKGTRVTVMKNGIPVGTVTANALGQFQIGGLRAGVHGLVVSGRGGYAAMSFQAVNELSMAAATPPLRSQVRFASARSHSSQFDGGILPVAIVPPTHIPAVLSTVHAFYPRAHRIKRIPTRMPSAEPSALRIGNADVSWNDIGNDYVSHYSNDGAPSNPLRFGCSTSTSSSSSSTPSALGGNRLGGLVGIAGAIAIPVAAADDDAAGIVSTNAGL